LDKALGLLDVLGRCGRGGVKALAEAAGLPPPTAHRLLAALCRAGYARQDPRSREYMLSLKLLELGAKVAGGLDLPAVARPVMKELGEISGETVNLVVFDGLEAVYVAQESASRSMLRMFTRVGARVPLHCTGVGKAYLASLDPARAQRIVEGATLARLTDKTITAVEGLLEELERVRQRGFAVDDEEVETGVRCVAALIPGPDGNTAGGMSISGPSARITSERIPGMGAALVRAAMEVSSRLGHAQARL
jgi:DNA-binding IclR family transcriptional regulator